MHPDVVHALILFLVFIYSTVFHEAAHAWAAMRLGDRTAYLGGQVSLDPIPHIRRAPIGMIVVPLIALFTSGGQNLMGWASAPFNPLWARAYPRREAWMALAGPAANIVLVLVSGAFLVLGWRMGWFSVWDYLTTLKGDSPEGLSAGAALSVKVLGIIFQLNILLAVINLLPFPPLDGACIPLLFLNGRTLEQYQEVIRSPSAAFVGMIVVLNGAGMLYGRVLGWAIGVLLGCAGELDQR